MVLGSLPEATRACATRESGLDLTHPDQQFCLFSLIFDLCLPSRPLGPRVSLAAHHTKDGSTEPRIEWVPVQTLGNPQGNVTVIIIFPSRFHSDSTHSELLKRSGQLTQMPLWAGVDQGFHLHLGVPGPKLWPLRTVSGRLQTEP